MKKYFYPLLVAIIILPKTIFAATCVALPNETFAMIVGRFACVANKTVIPALFSIAILIFIIGVVRFLSQGDNEEARKKGREFIIWGLICITIMITIWGFVRILVNTLDLETTDTIVIPEAPTYD